jgi:hypothetical protein
MAGALHLIVGRSGPDTVGLFTFLMLFALTGSIDSGLVQSLGAKVRRPRIFQKN